MKLLVIFALVSIGLIGCKDVVEDREIKGILTTDRSAYGNIDLEFKDKDSNLTRFIRPGKKIIQINKLGLSKLEIKLMESSRVQLGRLVVDKNIYKGDAKNFFIKNSDVGQDWDIQGKSNTILLKKEVYETRYSNRCQATCNGSSCEGLSGKVWLVTDRRNTFEINFLVANSEKVWGHFSAKGSLITSSEITTLSGCAPRKVIFNVDKEIFE